MLAAPLSSLTVRPHGEASLANPPVHEPTLLELQVSCLAALLVSSPETIHNRKQPWARFSMPLDTLLSHAREGAQSAVGCG
jgi:hypothetical protein